MNSSKHLFCTFIHRRVSIWYECFNWAFLTFGNRSSDISRWVTLAFVYFKNKMSAVVFHVMIFICCLLGVNGEMYKNHVGYEVSAKSTLRTKQVFLSCMCFSPLPSSTIASLYCSHHLHSMCTSVQVSTKAQQHTGRPTLLISYLGGQTRYMLW